MTARHGTPTGQSGDVPGTPGAARSSHDHSDRDLGYLALELVKVVAVVVTGVVTGVTLLAA